MSGANFQALLNTKAALDHGLVTEEDYNKIKESFLRAQELRSAIDAGLMNEQEIEQVKKDFVAMVAGQGRGGPHGSQNPARAVGGATKSAPPPPPPMSVMGEAKRSAPPPPAVPAAVPAPAQQKRAAPVPAPPPMPPPVAQQQGSNNAQPGMVPSNLPSIGEAKSIQIDGKSMSGIGLSADAVNIFYLVRSKSSYRWVIWKINDAGNEVVIDAVGAPSSTYQDFLTALPENDCRYASTSAGLFDCIVMFESILSVFVFVSPCVSTLCAH